MATFFKRGETWSFKMYVGFDANGKRKQKGVGGFRTKKDAIAAANAMESEVLGNTYVEEKDITFYNFSKDWLKMYGANAKASSVRVRQHEVDKLNAYFKLIKLKDITRKQYQDTLLDLQDKGFAENTISGVHGTARMIFKKAMELSVIKNDATQFARPPRKQQTLEDIENENEIPKYLEKDQLASFLRFAHDGGINDDYTLFLLLAYTGIRVGELCSLKWHDIDFTENIIKITKTYYNPTNNVKEYILQTPKTKSSKRTIHVSNKVIDELKKHQLRQEKLKEKLELENIKCNDENFIFWTKKYPGFPLYPKSIGNRMARLLKISDLPKELTPHSMRHTHTSLLAEAGVGLEEIMERLGHSDDDTTRKVYLHVTKDMKKEAAHKFDTLMDNL